MFATYFLPELIVADEFATCVVQQGRQSPGSDLPRARGLLHEVPIGSGKRAMGTRRRRCAGGFRRARVIVASRSSLMMKELPRGSGGRRVLVGVAIVAGLLGQSARAQIPGLPSGTSQPKSAASSEAAAEKAKAAVASSTGPITVHRQVDDGEIKRFLTKFLPNYPGVANLTVAVDGGVVTLDGRVDDDDTRKEITDVVARVEGVRLVVNNTDTDEEVMTGSEFALQELGNFRDYIARKWILILMALAIVAISWLLAQFFAVRSETLLAPVVHNVLLRSVVGSIISGLLVIGGLMLALADLATDPRGNVGRGRVGLGRPGRRIRIPRHHRELHRLGAAGRPPAVPDRRLRDDRRPVGGRQVAEYPGDRARHPRGEARPHPQFDHLQGDHGQRDGLAELPQQLRRGGPQRGLDGRRDRCLEPRPAGDPGHPHRPAAAYAGRGPGAGRRPPPRRLLDADPERRLVPAHERREAQGQGRTPAGRRHRLTRGGALRQAGGQGRRPRGWLQRYAGPGRLPQPHTRPPPTSPAMPGRPATTQAAVVKDGETPADRVLQEPETRVSDEGTNLIKDTRAE